MTSIDFATLLKQKKQAQQSNTTKEKSTITTAVEDARPVVDVLTDITSSTLPDRFNAYKVGTVNNVYYIRDWVTEAQEQELLEHVCGSHFSSN